MVVKQLQSCETISQEVEVLVATGNLTIKDKVVAKLVAAKLEQRTALVLAAISKKSEVRKAIYKCKPDQESFDDNGKMVSQTFTKAKAEELKKLREQADRIDAALTAALGSKPDYSKLTKEVGKEEE